MVKTPTAKEAFIPLGKPVTDADVALPPIAYLIVVIDVFSQILWLSVPTDEVNVSDGSGMMVTVLVRVIGTVQAAPVETETVVSVILVVAALTDTVLVPVGLKVVT